MDKKKIGFELLCSSRLVKRYIDSDATKIYVDKMTGTHGWALGFFHKNMGKDVFQRDFEQEFNIRRSTASNILSLMEKNGLITRESVPYDARLKKIVLTPKAAEMQGIVIDALEKMEAQMRMGISDEELEIFFSVLSKINKNLERKNDNND